MVTRTDQGPEEIASGRDHTAKVLSQYAGEGFDVSFRAVEGGDVVCGACGSSYSAAELTVVEERRLEGASDPDDMVLVEAVRCPRCAAGGAIVLGYGPMSSGADADVVAQLPKPTDEPGQDGDGGDVSDPGGDSDPAPAEG